MDLIAAVIFAVLNRIAYVGQMGDKSLWLQTEKGKSCAVNQWPLSVCWYKRTTRMENPIGKILTQRQHQYKPAVLTMT